jgi:O-antigen ligase
MLIAVVPFALVRVLDAPTRRAQARNGVAVLLMLAAAAATDRKTALLVPAALILYIALYRPRMLVRFAPAWLLVVPIVIHFAAPGALGALLHPNSAAASGSTTHRLADFSSLTPDLNVHPILGRGYGTTDPATQPENYRINDNQYLDVLDEVGVIGLVAYAWMILSPVVAARRAIRGLDRAAASLALAAAAGCVAFLVLNTLFDTLAFPQAAYMFFTVAAISTIVSSGTDGNCEPVAGVLQRARHARVGTAVEGRTDTGRDLSLFS